MERATSAISPLPFWLRTRMVLTPGCNPLTAADQAVIPAAGAEGGWPGLFSRLQVPLVATLSLLVVPVTVTLALVTRAPAAGAVIASFGSGRGGQVMTTQ